MCCEAFCRGLCSILSSSAILVLDIVDAAVGAALLFSPLLWSKYVTAAPATIALPSYGACVVIMSAISLVGVGFRSNRGLLAAAVLAALCFVTEFTGGLVIASDPDFAAKLGPRFLRAGRSSWPWRRCATRSAELRTARSAVRATPSTLYARDGGPKNRQRRRS